MKCDICGSKKDVNQAREEGYKQGYFEGRADMKKDILKL